jgi:membrane-associated protein
VQSFILSFILSFGYVGLAALAFGESGILLGFFLPGDSVFFSAGIIASQGALCVWVLVPLLCASAIAGDSFGYWIGTKIGPALFTREDSFLFKKRYVTQTQHYYETYGPLTIFLARFIPGVRTFAPTMAGVGRMRYRTFLRYNILGGVVWGGGVVLLGYFLGSTVPGIDHYLLPIISLIIVLSILPVAWEWYHPKKH